MESIDNIYLYSYKKALARYPVILSKMFDSELEFNEYKRKQKKKTEGKRWNDLLEKTAQ